MPMVEILYRQRVVREIENQVMVMRRLLCNDGSSYGSFSEFDQYREE